MSFFSFFYSNLARFKKFKGLGFEAELWEDKQNEAADLIDRLKNVVAIYTREVVMSNVMRGRWGGSESWKQRWSLLDELQGRHAELGQQIDFSALKRDVESVFIFDICSPLASSVRRTIEVAKAEANRVGTARFGNPVTDLEGYNAFHKQLRSIATHEDQLFERAKTENVAQGILVTAENARTTLQEGFSIELKFKEGLLERLRTLVSVIENRPIMVTPELISWADDHEAFAN